MMSANPTHCNFLEVTTIFATIYTLIHISQWSWPSYYSKDFGTCQDFKNSEIDVNQLEEDVFTWSKEIQDWTLSSSSEETFTELQKSECIWPEDCPQNDRIVNQLLQKADLHYAANQKVYKIALANDRSHPEGQELFINERCPFTNCLISNDLVHADAIVFSNSDVNIADFEIENLTNREAKSNVERAKHRSSQIWIAQFLESPSNTFDRRFIRKNRGRHEFNWTASYRSDADIVTPYSKFVPYSSQVRAYISLKHETTLSKSYNFKQALPKSIGKFYEQSSERHKKVIKLKQRGPKVAWLVSNCNAKNKRLEVARELAKYIQVNVYGKCGNLSCGSKWTQTQDCLNQLNANYKFYLSFENTNASEYITEKFYRNALGYNDPNYLVLPIVLGPKREDYERFAPPSSFIHVDDFESVEHLARYLKLLDEDNALYYSYFRWKTVGRFINTKFLCRVCSMLHNKEARSRVKIYSDVMSWWLNE